MLNARGIPKHAQRWSSAKTKGWGEPSKTLQIGDEAAGVENAVRVELFLDLAHEV